MTLLFSEQRSYLNSLISDLLAARLLDLEGGALSLRCDEHHLLFTPAGSSFRRWRIREEDFVVTDCEGSLVQSGNWLGPTGTPLHLELYRLFPECNAVLHTHAPHSLTFAALGLPVPSVTNLMDTLGEVPCLMADDTNIKQRFQANPTAVPVPSGMIQKPEMVLIQQTYLPQLKDVLLPRRAELLRHGLAFTLYRHGLFVFARSMDEACNNAVRVETSARTAIYSQLLTAATDRLRTD
jgi:L-ribulose-5-phosphate 4-epimerase